MFRGASEVPQAIRQPIENERYGTNFGRTYPRLQGLDFTLVSPNLPISADLFHLRH